jgi:LPXTG-motif cell wall-anchored protein
VSLNIRRLTVLAIALLSALAMTASAAFAQYPPASAFGVSCTDAAAGETADCTVVGAEANENITATAADDDGVFETQNLTANAEGEVAFAVDIPTDVRGNVVINVEGEQSGAASDTVAVEDEVAGTPVSGTPSLPMTGGEVGVLLLVALTLLGGGLLALRRREDSKVAADA